MTHPPATPTDTLTDTPSTPTWCFLFILYDFQAVLNTCDFFCTTTPPPPPSPSCDTRIYRAAWQLMKTFRVKFWTTSYNGPYILLKALLQHNVCANNISRKQTLSRNQFWFIFYFFKLVTPAYCLGVTPSHPPPSTLMNPFFIELLLGQLIKDLH